MRLVSVAILYVLMAVLLLPLLSLAGSYCLYDTIVISSIKIEGNKKTKDYIVVRELTMNAGDTLSHQELSLQLSISRENLLRLPLFHFVDIRVETMSQSREAAITIQLTERWYTWIWPVFEISDRNFNTWLENGDLTRLSYGLFFQQENFRGRLEKLHLRIKAGYQQQISLLYEAPYLNRTKTLGAGVLVNVARERETAFITRDNSLEYFRHSDFLRKFNEAGLFIRYRPGIYTSHTLTAQLNHYQFSDTLIALNPDYAGIASRETTLPSLTYLMKADHRDQRAYPLSGWYADLLAEWAGFVNQAEFNYLTLRASARIHHPLTERWNLAAGVAGKISTKGNKPWFRNQALGYGRDYVRGYEYQVVDGDNFWLLKANLKYALVPLKIFKAGKIKAAQFNTIPFSMHVGVYADAGKTWPAPNNEINSLQQKLLAGAGLGLDFVTYYDKVMRAEFSVNREGKAGFFLHFMAAI